MRPCAPCGRLDGCEVAAAVRYGPGGRALPEDLIRWLEHGTGMVLDDWHRHIAIQALDIDFNKIRESA